MYNWVWLVGLVCAVLFFGIVEAMAVRHPTRINTLSHVIAQIGATWPLSIWICGVFAGGLAVHFFWHFCPAFAVTGG